MTDTEPTRTTTCPKCGQSVTRPAVLWAGAEIMAGVPCLCDDCAEKHRLAAAAAAAALVWHSYCHKRIPDDYYLRADRRVVSAVLQPALAWRPTASEPRLGITGPPNTGKTMALALLVQALRLKFVWLTGFTARALYNRAVTAEDKERHLAAASWLQCGTVPLLVLDDVDKGNFTEAWSSALFGLMEARNSRQRPVVWTANHGPGRLADKFAKCGDRELSDGLERRLCGGATLISTTPKV